MPHGTTKMSTDLSVLFYFAVQSSILELVRNVCAQQCFALFGRYRPTDARYGE